MTDKQPNRTDGSEKSKTVTPDAGSAGESGGGAHPNPHTGKDEGGFDGGQTEKAYSGPKNRNATTE